jgi:hypothetical protein
MSTEVYRIVTSDQQSATSSSGGNVKLYTEQGALLKDLLPLQMKLERYKNRPESTVARVLLDFWRDMIGYRDPEMYPYPLNIRVERHVMDTLTGEGKWLLMSWSYEPPRVTFNGKDAE